MKKLHMGWGQRVPTAGGDGDVREDFDEECPTCGGHGTYANQAQHQPRTDFSPKDRVCAHCGYTFSRVRSAANKKRNEEARARYQEHRELGLVD